MSAIHFLVGKIIKISSFLQHHKSTLYYISGENEQTNISDLIIAATYVLKNDLYLKAVRVTY